MDYAAFGAACRLERSTRESFSRFALVGGILKYGDFVDTKVSAVDLPAGFFLGRALPGSGTFARAAG